jgi:hypothetical protein
MRAIEPWLVVTLLALSGCAAQPGQVSRVPAPSCGAKQVLYCVESGSRAGDGDCRCLSQEAAQGSLDNL